MRFEPLLIALLAGAGSSDAFAPTVMMRNNNNANSVGVVGGFGRTPASSPSLVVRFAEENKEEESSSSSSSSKSYLEDMSSSKEDDKSSTDDAKKEEEDTPKAEYLEEMAMPSDDVEEGEKAESADEEAGTAQIYETGVDTTEESKEDDEEEKTKSPYLEDMARFESELSEEEEEATVATPPPGEQDPLTTLLRIGTSTGRGEFASPLEKSMAADMITQLESSNPNPTPEEPANSPLMYGRWELLYSSTQLFRSSPFFMAGRAVCETPEQAKQYDWFCDMHRAALAISSIGQVRQIVSPTRLVSEFEVKVGAVPFLSDFTPFKYSGGLPITIEGAIVSSADITPTDGGKSWEIFMDTVEIKGSNIPGLRQALDQGVKLGSRDLGGFLESNIGSYTNPKPVFETTYLSDSIRISRDQDGKVFVYGKVSGDSSPTDYSSVDSDLGIGRLLEGFNDAITKLYL